MNAVLDHDYLLVRLYWAGDNLGFIVSYMIPELDKRSAPRQLEVTADWTLRIFINTVKVRERTYCHPV